MSSHYVGTPRVIIARHGETAWSKSGKFTGATDISMLPEGVKQISTTANALVGAKKFLDPSSLVRAFVSPRTRALETFRLLLPPDALFKEQISYTDDITEWDYGDYEGLTMDEIMKLRAEMGHNTDSEWSIWRDGCPGGESKDQVTERVDRAIGKIRDIQGPLMHGKEPADVLVVSHGLILRCFVKRWIGLEIDSEMRLKLHPGALAVLSYNNKDINQPCVELGLALPPAQATAHA